MDSKGKIEIFVGGMFCGKTSKMIRRVRRAMIAKQTVIVLKPAIDQRYDATAVVSHDRAAIQAQIVSNPKDILTKATDATVVGLDEVQFFGPEIIEVVEALRDQGKRVIIAGLDMDSTGKPFGVVPYLLAIADEITKLSAVCTVCGGDATMSQRTVVSDAQVLVGEKDAYDARCRNHWTPAPASQPESK